jgi:hypothetical protein
MKSIYNYEKTPNQGTTTITELTVTNNLRLTGANDGLLEVVGSNVGDIPNGPIRYLLEIDQSNNRPAWTNNIKVDEVETNTIKINGTSRGDLLVMDNSNEASRLPVGSSGQILTSNGITPEWQALILPDPFNLNDLTINNSLRISNLTNGFLYVNNTGNVSRVQNSHYQELLSYPISFTSLQTLITFPFNVISGFTYKVSVNFIHEANSNVTTYQIIIPSFAGKLITVSQNMPVTVFFIYTASFTGVQFMIVNGSVNTSISNASLFSFSAEVLSNM